MASDMTPPPPPPHHRHRRHRRRLLFRRPSHRRSIHHPNTCANPAIPKRPCRPLHKRREAVALEWFFWPSSLSAFLAL